jgi:hypothetical protein
MSIVAGITKCYKLYAIRGMPFRKAAYTLVSVRLFRIVIGLGNKFAMKIGLITVSIAFLLSIGMQSANAGPFGRIREARERARAERQQPHVPVQVPVQEEKAQTQGFPRNNPAPVFNPQAPGIPPGAPGGFAPQNQIRRFGPRMSIEERQRLRRQINEAGQDIYAPRK